VRACVRVCVCCRPGHPPARMTAWYVCLASVHHSPALGPHVACVFGVQLQFQCGKPVPACVLPSAPCNKTYKDPLKNSPVVCL
jgi:hypothetical protein